MAAAGLEEYSLDTSHTESGSTSTTGTLTSFARLAHVKDHKSWMTHIVQNGNKPADWLQYLRTVEENWATPNEHDRLSYLDQAYRRARECLPLQNNKSNEALATIFIKSAEIKFSLKLESKARYLLRYARANFTAIPSVHLAAAQFELDQGERPKAISILEKARVLCPGSDSLTEALRRAKSGQSRLKEAEENNTPQEPYTVAAVPLVAEQHPATREPKPADGPPDGDHQPEASHESGGFNHGSYSAFSRVPSACVKSTITSNSRNSSTSTPAPSSLSTPFGKGAPGGDQLNSGFKRPGSTSKSRSLPQRVLRQKLVLKTAKANNVDDDDDDEDDEDNGRDEHDGNLEDSIKPLVSPPDRPRIEATELSVITEDGDSGITVETPPTDDLRVDTKEQGGAIFSFPPRHEPVREATTGRRRVEFEEVDRPSSGQPESSKAAVKSDRGEQVQAEQRQPPIQTYHPPSSMQATNVVPCPNERRDQVLIKGVLYSIIKVIGKGGSSKVYQVLHQVSKKIFAVKYVDLECADDQIIQSYKNEITLLQRLQDKEPIIKLYDFEIAPSHIYLVMECGSIDLASFLRRKRVQKEDIQFYWRQMLMAVQCIHDEGIIHRDLKPANFLFVEGSLKLIDFGIANSIQADRTSVTRESQVGTLNYMSPEMIQSGGDEQGGSESLKINCKSDVWSLGCILYYIIYGKTPFQQITNTVMKLQAICNSQYKIQFPEVSDANLLDVVKSCLVRDVKKRPSIKQLLEHPYVTQKRNINESPKPTLGTTTTMTKSEVQNLMSKLSGAQCSSPRSMELALALQKYLGSHHDLVSQDKENRKPLHEVNPTHPESKNQLFHQR